MLVGLSDERGRERDSGVGRAGVRREESKQREQHMHRIHQTVTSQQLPYLMIGPIPRSY